MSNKSKKAKKPKVYNTTILSAIEIQRYIHIKYDIDNDEFWNWFFGECSSDDTNFLSLRTDDYSLIKPEFKEYFNILKDDFLPDADEDLYLEIKNDF
jgi:hypothetical protein